MKTVIQKFINAICGILPLLLCSAKSQDDPGWRMLLIIPVGIIIIIIGLQMPKWVKKYVKWRADQYK